MTSDEVKKKAVEALRDVHEIFEEHGIDLWLDAGTLLGAVREGGLIPWDNDFDISAWHEDTLEIFHCCELLRERGYIVDYLVFDNESFELSHISINYDRSRSFPIDLRMFRPEGDFIVKINLGYKGKSNRIRTLFRRFNKYVLYLLSKPEFIGDRPPMIPNIIHVSTAKIVRMMPHRFVVFLRSKYTKFLQKLGYVKGEKKLPIKYFREFDTIDYYGMDFKIPPKTEEFLVFRYGEDWRIPDREWKN
ncbi:MAG: LicD family protein [Thermoplasmata archaeon]